MPDILYTIQIHIKVHIQKVIGNLYILIEGKSKKISGGKLSSLIIVNIKPGIWPDNKYLAG